MAPTSALAAITRTCPWPGSIRGSAGHSDLDLVMLGVGQGCFKHQPRNGSASQPHFRLMTTPVSAYPTPRVVILQAEANNGRSIVMQQRLGEFQYQRISRIKRDVHLTAQDEILLRIVLTHAINESGAAERVARIKSHPKVIVERIADVSFQSGERLLP